MKDKRLKASLEDDELGKRHFGVGWAKIRLRTSSLHGAISLADFWPPKSGMERCHELGGGRIGTFSMDVKQPFRLLFKPINGGDVASTDQQARWQSITAIEIIGIEDTHG
ncbi:MAG: killer suppression protein [Fibrobacteria bacterium]